MDILQISVALQNDEFANVNFPLHSFPDKKKRQVDIEEQSVTKQIYSPVQYDEQFLFERLKYLHIVLNDKRCCFKAPGCHWRVL